MHLFANFDFQRYKSIVHIFSSAFDKLTRLKQGRCGYGNLAKHRQNVVLFGLNNGFVV